MNTAGRTATLTAVADKATTDLAPIATSTVDAPAGPSTGGTRCTTTTWYYNVNGQVSSGTRTTPRAQLSWGASTSPRVTGYVITPHGRGRSAEVTEVPAAVLSVSDSYDGAYADQSITAAVTARTDYGWTAESPESGVFKC